MQELESEQVRPMICYFVWPNLENSLLKTILHCAITGMGQFVSIFVGQCFL